MTTYNQSWTTESRQNVDDMKLKNQNTHIGYEMHYEHTQTIWMTKYALHKHKNDNYDEMNEFEHDFKDQKRHYESHTRHYRRR
eukprot:4845529-Amphidinium_carterae.1